MAGCCHACGADKTPRHCGRVGDNPKVPLETYSDDQRADAAPGGGILYLATLVEGASMCLVSKVINPALAAGLFNAGAPTL